MIDDPIISVGSSQREWAGELTRFVSDYGGARLRGTVLTAEDALEQDYQILIVDDIASYLTPRLVEQVQRRHRKIIGVFDPDSGVSAKDRLQAIGVDAVLDALAMPEEFLVLVKELAAADPAVTVSAPVSEAAVPVFRDEPHDPFDKRSGLLAVVGGDPATDVCLALADTLVGAGRSCVVVDVDTSEPSLAQRLALPLAPNLLTATDSFLQMRGGIDEWVRHTPRGFGVLAGIPTPDDWESVQARDIVELTVELGGRYREVIAKIGPGVEDLAPLSGRAGRFDVNRAVLGAAREIIVTAESTPLGLSRLLMWVARLRRLSEAPVHVVFLNAPRSAYQRGELSEELVRSFVPASIVWLPRDPRQQRAVWNAELTPPGPYVRAIRLLATRLGEPAGVGT